MLAVVGCACLFAQTCMLHFSAKHHKCLRISKSRSILLIPDDHRVDGPIRNRGQSACLFNHLLSTIVEPM